MSLWFSYKSCGAIYFWSIDLLFDEKAVKKGHGYAMILRDSTKGTILDWIEDHQITSTQDGRHRGIP